MSTIVLRSLSVPRCCFQDCAAGCLCTFLERNSEQEGLFANIDRRCRQHSHLMQFCHLLEWKLILILIRQSGSALARVALVEKCGSAGATTVHGVPADLLVS